MGLQSTPKRIALFSELQVEGFSPHQEEEFLKTHGFRILELLDLMVTIVWGSEIRELLGINNIYSQMKIF